MSAPRSCSARRACGEARLRSRTQTIDFISVYIPGVMAGNQGSFEAAAVSGMRATDGDSKSPLGAACLACGRQPCEAGRFAPLTAARAALVWRVGRGDYRRAFIRGKADHQAQLPVEIGPVGAYRTFTMCSSGTTESTGLIFIPLTPSRSSAPG